MLTVLILAAGQGKRMVSDVPKILHPVGGRPMVHHVIDAIAGLNPQETVVVVSPSMDCAIFIGNNPVHTVVQPAPLGTGNAVKVALESLPRTPETVLVACGDTPLLETAALQAVLQQHQARPSPCLTIVGMRPGFTNSYGRIMATASGQIEKIVEYRDASEAERAVPVCHSGILAADGKSLKRLVNQLTPQNQAGEYYLTDVVGLAQKEGIPCWLIELPAGSLQGINTRIELAEAEKTLQTRWRKRFMEQGVTLIDPGSVFFSWDTRIGRDVTLSPNVTFGKGVVIGDGVTILPGCHIENSILGDNVTIGPFAHLRDGTHLENHVTVGNFVEIKGSTLASHSKAKHLTYLGNARVGKNVNIGAGTITCNHNGFVKSPTSIQDNAYIGSNSCLVAPVTVGEGAMVAAGSVITADVPAQALGIGRSRQENKPAWAARFRARFKKPDL